MKRLLWFLQKILPTKWIKCSDKFDFVERLSEVGISKENKKLYKSSNIEVIKITQGFPLLGNVRHNKTGIILKWGLDKDGYFLVVLMKNKLRFNHV